MFIFIRKIALFILLFILPLVLFEAYVRNQWIDPFDAKRAYLENEINTCEIIVLGTSHAWSGLNPEWISEDCLNLANAFQPFYYDYKILEKYAIKMESLQTVILPMSYTSFFNKPSDYHQNLYSIYWDLSPYGKPMIGDHSLVLSLGLKTLIERLINGENNFVNRGWLKLDGSFNGSVELTAKRMGMMHEVMDMENWEESINWLEKIITLSSEQNIRLILFTPPYSKELNRQLGKYPYQKKIDRYLMELSENKNIELYQLNDNAIFGNNLFKDADHLNSNGAKKLSEKLQEILSNPITNN